MNLALAAEIKADYLQVDPDPIRVDWLIQLVEEANALGDGNYIEVGTHWGLTAKIIHRSMDPTKQLYAFDTFDGFDQRDLDIERAVISGSPWQTGSSENPAENHNFWPTSVEKVKNYLGHPDNLTIVKGWFPDSFEGYEEVNWRFAHIDVDLYQPTLSALLCIWPRLLPGGVVVIHDYGNKSFGAEVAVDDWCEREGATLQKLNDYHNSVVLRKAARI